MSQKQKDEISSFKEEDYLINLLNKNNVLVGGFKPKKSKQTEKDIIKQASIDEGKKAKTEKKDKKAETKKDKKAKKEAAKKEKKEKKIDAKTAIEQSKHIHTKNLKSRIESAKQGISKENIKNIDNIAKDEHYRTNLREIVNKDISKLDNAKIDEMMPKDLSAIIKGVETKNGTNKPLSIDQKRKILAEYKINMIDTKTFKDGSSGFKRRMQQSIYNIHSISHGRMSSLKLPEDTQKSTQKAANELKTKIDTANVGNSIKTIKDTIDFENKKQNLQSAVNEKRGIYNKTNLDLDFVKNIDIKAINVEQIVKNSQLEKLKEQLKTATNNNTSKSIATQIYNINNTLKENNSKIKRVDDLIKEKGVTSIKDLEKKLDNFEKQHKKQLQNTIKNLNKHITDNPDKTFKPQKYANSIINVKDLNEGQVKDLSDKKNKLIKLQLSLKEVGLTNNNKMKITENISQLKKQINTIMKSDVNFIDKQINNLITKKGNKLKNLESQLKDGIKPELREKLEGNIDKVKKEIIVEKKKLDILQQKQTDTTKSDITKSLQEQGFSKNEIDKAIEITKNKELFGDTIKDKMSELKFIIDKTIKSPDFKIDVNTGKISELQSKLEGSTNKMEQSKLRRQISDLETANKKLEKRKSIMNNSVNNSIKRKDKGKLVAVINKKLSSVDRNLQFFEKEFNVLSQKKNIELTPGDKAKINRYEQLQQNKSRLESRKSEIQKQITNKTFAKGIIKGINTKSIKKMSNKDFEIFKTSMEPKLDTPEKKKEFQTRFEVFKDALDKGSNSIAKSQAQFIKGQYGIDVKEFKLDNLSKMGEFFKNNVATLDKKREVSSLLNKRKELQNQKNTILKKYNKELKTFENKQGYSLSVKSSSKPSNNFQKTKKGKALGDELKKLQEQVKIIENQKSNNYNITKQVIDNKIKSNFNNYLTEFDKFRNKYSGPRANNLAKKDFDETPNGKKYKKHIEDLKKERNKIENILNIQNKIKSLKKTNTPDNNPNTPVNNPKTPVNNPNTPLKKSVSFALPVNKPKKSVSFGNQSQAGGNLNKRLHPKKKYSKKAYQFSKSKNRTKKQLI